MFFKNFFLNATEAVTEALTAIETAVETAVETVVETGAVETANVFDLTFHPENFVKELGHMGTGLLAIFVVIGVIIGAVYALDVIVKAFSVKLPKK